MREEEKWGEEQVFEGCHQYKLRKRSSGRTGWMESRENSPFALDIKDSHPAGGGEGRCSLLCSDRLDGNVTCENRREEERRTDTNTH